MGITRLEKYQAVFRPAGFEFTDYLDAYALGLGGAADAIPIGTTDFKFLIGQVAWEHSWMKGPKDWYRVNTEVGLILLGLFLPTPYAGIRMMAGTAPFFVKLGVGGHAAVNLRLGVEVASRFKFTLLAVPLGTQPVVNYIGGFKKWEGPSSGPIHFPYYGLLFTYKMPLPMTTP